MMMVLGKYLSSDVVGLVAMSRLRDSLDELCTKHIATRNGMAHLSLDGGNLVAQGLLPLGDVCIVKQMPARMQPSTQGNLIG